MASKRVLLVDDSFGDRLVMTDVFMSAGCRVIGEAKNFEDSLDKIRNLKPDLVVIDAAIPSIDGVSAVIRILRQDPDACILISASRGQRMLALEGVAAGAKDFITKPVNLRQLRRTLQGITYGDRPR